MDSSESEESLGEGYYDDYDGGVYDDNYGFNYSGVYNNTYPYNNNSTYAYTYPYNSSSVKEAPEAKAQEDLIKAADKANKAHLGILGKLKSFLSSNYAKAVNFTKEKGGKVLDTLSPYSNEISLAVALGTNFAVTLGASPFLGLFGKAAGGLAGKAVGNYVKSKLSDRYSKKLEQAEALDAIQPFQYGYPYYTNYNNYNYNRYYPIPPLSIN